MTNECPICSRHYERKVVADNEQLRIETHNLGSPDSNKRTTGIGTHGTELCVRSSVWGSGYDVYLH